MGISITVYTFSQAYFDAANMASLMLIVFLVEATVSFINAVGAAKINDLVRLSDSPWDLFRANSLGTLC